MLTSDVVFGGSAESPELTGHDGCDEYGGSFIFDGDTVVTDDLEADAPSCGVDVLAIRVGDGIELLPGARTFTLRAEDGQVIARFTDYGTLEPAEADDMPYAWYIDDLEVVEFTETGRGIAALCTWLEWEEQGNQVAVTLPDPERHQCGFVEGDDGVIPFSPVATEIRELTTGGTEVKRITAGLLLAGDRGAIQLRALPPVEVDPNGVTIAAGALFGIQPGVGVTPEEVIDAASPILGPPDHDTGWIDRRDLDVDVPIQDCGLDDYREIVWGDLVTGFWGSRSRTVLQFWYTGDRRVIGTGRTRGPTPRADRDVGPHDRARRRHRGLDRLDSRRLQHEPSPPGHRRQPVRHDGRGGVCDRDLAQPAPDTEQSRAVDSRRHLPVDQRDRGRVRLGGLRLLSRRVAVTAD